MVKVLIVLYYTFFTLFFTYPVFLNPERYLYGFSGDNFGLVWNLWWRRQPKFDDLKPDFTSLFNAPEGATLTSLPGEIGWAWPLTILSSFVGEVLAFNIVVFLGFLLSGLAMYFLSKYLWGSRAAALLAGLIYMLAPFRIWQSYTHLGLSLTFSLPLVVGALFYFDRERNWRSVFFLSFSFALTFYTSFYFGFFAALVISIFLILQAISKPSVYLSLRSLKLLILSLLAVVLVCWPILSDLLRLRVNPAGGVNPGVVQRQLDELIGLSARPWDYFIYPPNHPLFGRFNKNIYDFIQSQGSDFKVRSAYLPERVVFLGFTAFLLALMAVWFGVRDDKKIRRLCLLVLICFLISMPAYFYLRGKIFYTPSFFLYQIIPWVRVYARFGVFVLIFVTLLASATLARFFKKIKNRFAVYTLVSLLSLLIVFEFLPDFRAFTDLQKIPQSYVWLARQPKGLIVAEYPKGYDLQTALLYQRIHGQRLFNMPDSYSRYRLWPAVSDLTSPQARSVLKAEGVSYVLYHLQDPTPNPYDDWRFFRAAKRPTEEELKLIETNGFRLISDFPDGLIFGVD